MLARWFSGRRAADIDTPAALEAILVREANLVTQKCLIGYCHAITLLPMNELMRDKGFARAYDKSCAEAFAAVLADFVLVIESRLRRACAPTTTIAAETAVADALAATYARLLAVQPKLSGHVDVAAASRAFAARMEAARQAAPRASADIAAHSGEALYHALPIHERLRRADRDTVVASVRFMMMARVQLLDRQLACAALAASLAAANAGSGAAHAAPPQ